MTKSNNPAKFLKVLADPRAKPYLDAMQKQAFDAGKAVLERDNLPILFKLNLNGKYRLMLDDAHPAFMVCYGKVREMMQAKGQWTAHDEDIFNDTNAHIAERFAALLEIAAKRADEQNGAIIDEAENVQFTQAVDETPEQKD